MNSDQADLLEQRKKASMNTCQSCKYFAHQDFIGTCGHPKVVVGYKNLPDDGISIEHEDDLMVGPNFGCIRHDASGVSL